MECVLEKKMVYTKQVRKINWNGNYEMNEEMGPIGRVDA